MTAAAKNQAITILARQANLPVEVFRQAVDQADLAVSITDASANVLYANDAFARITGYAEEEVLGRNASLLSNQTTPRSMYESMWQQLVAGKSWSGRLLNRRKNGDLYLADLAITPVHDAEGCTTHYLGMHRDVTGLHQLECQVRNQKHLIESVIDAAPVVFALLDINGRVLLDNHAYKKLVTDLGIAEPVHALLDTLNPGWREQLTKQESSCEFTNREARVDRAQGQARWFSCTASLIRLDDEEAGSFFCGVSAGGLLLICNDISSLRVEQERTRTAALQSLLLEEERVASIRESLSAALFRLEEPMNVMASAVKLLQRRDPVSADVLQDALSASREHIDSLRQVIPPHAAESMFSVNLNEALRDVLDICTPDLLAAGIVVDWLPSSFLPSILGRPMQMRVLFKALIENAIEAMDVKGWRRRELSISTSLADGCVVVQISDSGPGMPDEWRVRAFEPFFTTKNGAGHHLGTGLARAQHIVADHGGFIDLGPSASGGCVVTVDFRLDGDPL